MSLVDRAAKIKAELLRITPLAIATLPDNDKVLCVRGHPGTNMPDDVLTWGQVSASQEPGPLSSTNRARDVTYTFTLTASIFRGGGPEAEGVAEDRAHALISAVEEYVRVTDTTLGGLVFWCFCTALDSNGATPPEVLSKGRIIDVDAVFTAYARITSR